MVEIAGTNITSALGNDTSQCYRSVLGGECGLQHYDATILCVAEDFVASRVDTTHLLHGKTSGITRLEIMAIHSIKDALKYSKDIDPTSPRTVFIISSTKGNIDLLDKSCVGVSNERVYLPVAARYISQYMGNPNQPVVVSNACISGLSALILAKRLLDNKIYDHAIVCGVDLLTRFTVSGFQSFKALSSERCRPFDAGRTGLNLGEAAATIILSNVTTLKPGAWTIERTSMHNDANHISGPSRVGEGSYRCLRDVTQDIDTQSIAVINTHGTATLYNDEMESIAIDRAGLSQIPVNAYKSYLGHTLGAAGILECILTLNGLNDGILMPVMGFETPGVSRKLDIVATLRKTNKTRFVKMLSGFGGCNAAMTMRKEVAL